MKCIDRTLSTPEQNLACDEALLDWCAEGFNDEILRFWEPQKYFVVLGYSGKVNLETNTLACRQGKIPILRRASGGGTVLQGPGCLNFSLILKINQASLKHITQTNAYVLKRHQKALEPIIGQDIKIQGLSDLTLGSLKFSGNAQRRKQHHVLFHGTFLLRFDISRIADYLPVPSKQPDYRQNRTHQGFLTNLNVEAAKIKSAIQRAWNATDPLDQIPQKNIDELVRLRYSADTWNYKF